MNLLFVHDHKFYEDNNIFYSRGGFPQSVWDRYLGNFSSIIVIGRKLHNKSSSLVKSSKKKS